jgi:hypothetical protein
MAGDEEKPGEPPPDGVGGPSETKNQKGQRVATKKPYAVKTTFEGKCEDLKGHIFDCTGSTKAADCPVTKATGCFDVVKIPALALFDCRGGSMGIMFLYCIIPPAGKNLSYARLLSSW